MALSNAIKGALRPSQPITWTRNDEDATPEDLTGATLSGWIRRQNATEDVAITGALVVTNATAGAFRWDYSASDVSVAGLHYVKFVATFADAPTPAKTEWTHWEVRE